MINWQYYPKSDLIPSHLTEVVEIFEKKASNITSSVYTLQSNEVLKAIEPDLMSIGYDVETGKKMNEKIHIPVLFGMNGKLEKYFEADAYQKSTRTVLEVEAGRGVTNYQFLKDLFQACMMHNVDYLIIAIRNTYRTSNDFLKVLTFFDTLYASGRLTLPLSGILIIGY